LDYLTRPVRRGIRADGEHGTLVWNAIDGTVSAFIGKAAAVKRSVQTRDQTHVEQLQAFLNSINGKKDERLASCLEGIQSLAICDAARRSSAAGSIQKVKSYE
jgi:predicted dehydrogenase